jgi:hypothetical protein
LPFLTAPHDAVRDAKPFLVDDVFLVHLGYLGTYLFEIEEPQEGEVDGRYVARGSLYHPSSQLGVQSPTDPPMSDTLRK